MKFSSPDAAPEMRETYEQLFRRLLRPRANPGRPSETARFRLPVDAQGLQVNVGGCGNLPLRARGVGRLLRSET